MSDLETCTLNIQKVLSEEEHLYFTRYFFKQRQGIKFRVNWHHALISDTLQRIIDGEIQNVTITVPPGSSKTEMAVINFIARGLALNPRARFLHLSGSDSLASLNSSTSRDIVTSDAYQSFWPLKIAEDAKAKKRWNVLVDDQAAGGVYATSLGGQITGFRAGHMAEGFQGAIIIDDPIKPEDAYSPTKLNAANRKLLSTIKSRRANPKTPIVVIMQRIAESDPVGFIKSGNLGGEWLHIKIPAVLTDSYIDGLDEKYQEMIDRSEMVDGRMSYWEYKEPLQELLKMESGQGTDAQGSRISRQVFSSQYQQEPTALGGNIIKSSQFVMYKVLPPLKYRNIYSDTAQKTKESNDRSVFSEWALGEDGRIYAIDLMKGKWEAPELQKMAVAFWAKCKDRNRNTYGELRNLMVEDKSSGTGLIQTLKRAPYNIPIKAIVRDKDNLDRSQKDKLTRLYDMLPYIESGMVCLPEDAPWVADFIAECEAFTPDDTHDYDDQVDTAIDAIMDMLSSLNKIKIWEALA